MCPETGQLIAAYPQCYKDLSNKILRHLAVFHEDPLRVFRLARFAAKLPDFMVAPETIELARKLCLAIQVEPAERIWAETVRALTARQPSRFFYLLKAVGCLSYWFKELHDLIGIPAGLIEHHPEADTFDHVMNVLDKVSLETHDPVTRWAAIRHDLGKAATDPAKWPKHHNHDKAGVDLAWALGHRLKVGNRFRKAGQIAAKQHMRVHRLCEMKPGKAVKLLNELSKFPGGMLEFFHIVTADGTCNIICARAILTQQILTKIRLPKHLRNKGKASGQSLLNLKAVEYKQLMSGINGDCISCKLHPKNV